MSWCNLYIIKMSHSVALNLLSTAVSWLQADFCQYGVFRSVESIDDMGQKRESQM